MCKNIMILYEFVKKGNINQKKASYNVFDRLFTMLLKI